MQKRAFSSDAKSLAYYEKTMLHKSGWSLGYGQYDLRSLDGGKQWHAVQEDCDKGVTILGTAEEVFPGLLDHLQGLDALTSYARKNGPLTPERGLKLSFSKAPASR
ncbi:hypothetical protein ACFL11_00645 [Patescibacteria group bacterium]